ncbi:MAG: hypothetical protein PVSMB7_04580 [Chloroflexota bacterium]
MKRIGLLVLAVLVVPWQLWGNAHPVSAAPAISISPASVAPGGTIQVTGSGFTASASGSSVALCTNLPVTPVCTAIPLSSAGTFTVNISVPASISPGTYQVTVLQTASPVQVASFTVVAPAPQPAPTLTVSSGTIASGQSLTVSGAHWPASSQVTLCVGLPGYGCQAVSTSAAGTFQVQIVVPTSAPSGAYAVTAQTGTNNPVTAQVSVVAVNRITLSPATAVPGQAEIVTGTGFGPGETVAISFPALFIEGGKAPEEVRGVADTNGTFSIPLPIPTNEVAGNYIVTVRGLSTGRQSTALMNVAAEPALSLSESAATPGTKITVTGRRWSSNWPLTVSARVLLTNHKVIDVSVSTQADLVGNFTVQIKIPDNAAPGPVSFGARQVQGGQTYTANATVTVRALDPGIQLSALSVLPGGSVTVYLHGFALGGTGSQITLFTEVTVQGGRQSVMVSVIPDAAGGAVATLSIPSGALPGKITVSATQPASGATISQAIEIAEAAATSTPVQTPIPPPPPPPSATATPTPTSTPLSVPVLRPLKFKRLGLWYTAAIVGSFNHIKVRANRKEKIGVDVTVTYPSGTVLHYRGITTRLGRWSKTFPVPRDAIRGRLRTALVQAFLIQGTETSLERSLTFRLVRR